MLAGISMGCEVSASKRGCCLYALRCFNRQGRKLDGFKREAHGSWKLDEARLLEKMAKCEINETYIKIDGT